MHVWIRNIRESFITFGICSNCMQIMNNNQRVIGIDVGGTKISAALFRPDGVIDRRNIQPVAKKTGKQVVKTIGAMALSLMNHGKKGGCQVEAIGVGVPGIYDPVKKTVWAPNIPGWDHIPLWTELTEIINDSSVKLCIDSDRSCYILGEVWRGCAKGCTDAIFVAVGTGIGAGILSNNRIITGHNGIAGAIGWLVMETDNFENSASGTGIARIAKKALSENRVTASVLDSISIDKITSYDVFSAFEKQDAVANAVIEDAIKYWGMCVANLVSIFNPQKIILGGGVFGPAIPLIDRIYAEAQKWAQPLSIQQVTLEPSTLQGDAGLYGAGYLAINVLSDQTHDG
jgi:glucokinase